MNNHLVAAVLVALIFAPGASLAQAGGDTASPPSKSNSADAPAQAKPGGPDTPTPAKPGEAEANTPAKPGGPAASLPIKPGSVRVTTKAPEPDKWDAQRSANGLQRIFKCKVLACSDPETVSISFLKSPTRHPDPQALEKFAKIDLPKSIRAVDAQREILTDGAERIETLNSKTATLKGYPAVLNESKVSRDKKSVFLNMAIIFAGPAMIRIQSVSESRDLAQKSLNQFVEVMRIEEGPPLLPGSPVPANGLEEQL
jgi:hypothetical protein